MTSVNDSSMDGAGDTMESSCEEIEEREDVERTRPADDESETLQRPLLPADNDIEDHDPLQREEENEEARNAYAECVASSWNRFLGSTWWLVLAAMVTILWPTGLMWALPEFQKHTDSTFHRGIEGSPSQLAEQAMEEAYSIGNASYDDDSNSSSTSLLLEPAWIVVVHATSSSKIQLSADPYARQLALGMKDYLLHGTIPNTTDAILHDESNPGNVIIQVSSYYDFQQHNLSLLADPFMSRDEKTTMIQVQCSILQVESNETLGSSDVVRPRHENNGAATTAGLAESDLMARLHDYYTKIMPPPTDISVSVTGLEYFSRDLRDSTKRDLTRMDILVIPCALLLVGAVLQSRHDLPYSTALCRLWIIPLCCIASTIATWSLLMNPIARAMQITQFTPSIMMSLTLGMGIDYTLFLLTRYLESMRRQQKVRGRYYHHQASDVAWKHMKETAIHEMLLHGGQVVLVSGCTLMCTFLGLVFLPLAMLKSIGVGAAVSLLSAMAMNVLFIVPALLYSPLGTSIVKIDDSPAQNHEIAPGEMTLPTRQVHQDHDGALASVTNTTPSETSASEANNNSSDQAPNRQRCVQGPDTDGSRRNDPLQVETPPKSFWVWLCEHYLLHPYKSVICMLIILQFFWLPVAKNALRVQASNISFDSLLPKNSPSIQAYHLLENEIGGGPGRMTPFRLLFVVDGDTDDKKNDHDHRDGTTSYITDAAAFDVMHGVLFHLMHPTSNYSSTSTRSTVSTGMRSHENIPRNSSHFIASQTRVALPPHNIEQWQLRSLRGTDGSTDDIFSNLSDTLFSGLSRNIREQQARGSQIQTKEDVEATRIAALARFTGISVWNNIPIPHAAYAAAKICTHNEPDIVCPVSSMRALDLLDRMMTSSNQKASIVTVSLAVSPFSRDGIAWLDQARRILSDYEQHNRLSGVDIYIDGTAAIAHDAVTAVYGNFTQVIAITIIIVMALMGSFFHSIVPPLRSIVSIVCTLSFSYGLAVLVYQDGIFDNYSTHARSVMALSLTNVTASSPAELCWLVPIMSFSIMIGLALDYDVFLISRVFEFRVHHNYQHDTSIAAGLDATGGIITAAGIIMAISFGSVLAISDSPALQQWSFLLTTAVLLDTFVIRTLVVPILTGWIGPKYGWYPRQLPLGNVRWGTLDERHDTNTEEDGENSED